MQFSYDIPIMWFKEHFNLIIEVKFEIFFDFIDFSLLSMYCWHNNTSRWDIDHNIKTHVYASAPYHAKIDEEASSAANNNNKNE